MYNLLKFFIYIFYFVAGITLWKVGIDFEFIVIGYLSFLIAMQEHK